LTSPKIGVVGIPGKWSTEVLADAIEARTGFRLVIDMGAVSLELDSGRLLFQEQDLCQLDALIVKKISQTYSPDTLDRLEMLRIAGNAGVLVCSPAESMLRLIDRLSCTVTLRNANIPMPATRVTEDTDAAIKAVKEFGSAVFKPLYSTKARGMCVIDASLGEAQLRTTVLEFQAANPVMYIQQKIELPGQDLGMAFLAGEYIGSYARVSQGDAWNTTINSGGRYAAFDASAELIELARRAQAPFNMTFTTVDVAETASGPIVFEVSAFGGFRGLQDGLGINIAERYTDHVLSLISTQS
jgi:tetrahydromethanopterin:alpha-L-glutamate ligase